MLASSSILLGTRHLSYSYNMFRPQLNNALLQINLALASSVLN